MKERLVIVFLWSSLLLLPTSLWAQGGHLFEGGGPDMIIAYWIALALVAGSLFLPLLLILIKKMGCQLKGPFVINYLLPFPSSIIAFIIAEDHLLEFILTMVIIQLAYILLLWGYCWRRKKNQLLLTNAEE